MATRTKKTVRTDAFVNATTILNTAIRKGISVGNASVSEGFGKNYVSDVKLTLDARIARGSFTAKQGREFRSLYKQYQKANA